MQTIMASTTRNASVRPSGKTFQPALLQALFNLTGGQPNRLCQTSLAITETCRVSGIGENDHGTQESSGKPWVYTWIQVAWSDLRRLGQGIDDAPRGRWGLTPSGVAAAQALSNLTDSIQAGIVAKPVSVQSFAVPSVLAEVAPILADNPKVFHEDEHIVKLAILRTSCFKSYSQRSPVCAGCSLQGPCRDAQNTELAAMAVQWRVLANKPVLTAADVAAMPAAKVKHDNKGIEDIICAVEAICSRCDKVIAKGADCHYIQAANGESLMFHTGCK